MQTFPYRIILASNSPRRKQLLGGLDVPFEVKTLLDIDESFSADMPYEDVPQFLAQKKANAYRDNLSEKTLLVTADTVVILDEEILGKPKDEDEARRMLTKLSGRTHRVVTGVCLTTQSRQICFSETANVTFGHLTAEEIDYYVAHYRPLDKAGAYGVQEWIGYVAVQRIEGSYFNVMGLPIFRVYEELKRNFGVQFT